MLSAASLNLGRSHNCVLGNELTKAYLLEVLQNEVLGTFVFGYIGYHQCSRYLLKVTEKSHFLALYQKTTRCICETPQRPFFYYDLQIQP